jgi:hypothetical protein
MRKSARIVALKIVQILEEYSDQDIDEACKILTDNGIGGKFIQYLSSKSPQSEAKAYRRKITENGTSRKVIDTTVSRAVLNLQDSDPQKYKVLLDFDRSVRAGSSLRTNEAVRRFGEKVSKSFDAGKSRKESISALMNVLALRSVSEIQQLIQSAIIQPSDTSDDYQHLAEFLIKGKQD